jgi:Domain of unknown function (DUF4252)
MHTRAVLFCLLALLLGTVATTAVVAASSPPASPGALPFGELEIFARKDLTTEINLEGAFLKLIASATSEDDPDFARLVSGLQAIRVQVAPLRGLDAEKVHAKMDQAVRWLEAKGWTAVVRIREKEEESYIYSREVQGQIVGLAVLSFEPGKEAAVVNIFGHLDPDQIGRLGRGLHVHQLEKVPSKEKDKPRVGSKRPG